VIRAHNQLTYCGTDGILTKPVAKVLLQTLDIDLSFAVHKYCITLLPLYGAGIIFADRGNVVDVQCFLKQSVSLETSSPDDSADALCRRRGFVSGFSNGNFGLIAPIQIFVCLKSTVAVVVASSFTNARVFCVDLHGMEEE
jgi:hypothetical protein